MDTRGHLSKWQVCYLVTVMFQINLLGVENWPPEFQVEDVAPQDWGASH